MRFRSPGFNRWPIGLLLMLRLGTPDCVGQENSVSLFDLGCDFRHWSADDETGPPGDIIYFFDQESDGHLWLGTSRGMSRFDGAGFEFVRKRADHWSADWNIHQIFRDSDNHLWAASISHGVLKVNPADGDSWTQIDVGGKRGPVIGKIIEDLSGRLLYVVGSRDLLQVRQLSGDSSILLSERRGRDQSVLGLEMSQDGTVWGVLSYPFGSPDTSLFYLDEGEIVPLEMPGEPDGALAFWRERTSGALRLVGRHGTYRLEGRQWIQNLEFDKKIIGESDSIYPSAQDDHGLLWIPTPQQGLLVCTPDGRLREVGRRGGFSPTGYYSVYCDRDGTIWAGSRSGVFQIYRPPFVPWPASPEIRQSNVDCISEDGEGTIWFSGSSGAYYLQPGGEVVPAPGVKERIQAQILGLSRGGALRVDWKGDVYEQTTTSSKLLLERTSNEPQIVDLFESQDGRRLVSRMDGLMELKENRLEPVLDHHGKPVPSLYSMATGPEGSVIGSDGRLLWQGDDYWKSTAGLGGVRKLSITRGGFLWAALNQQDLGFVRLSDQGGAFALDGTLLGLPRSFNLMADQGDGLWIQGGEEEGGIMRFDCDSLEASIMSQGEKLPVVQRYGTPDGLPSTRNLEVERSLFEASDGKIWVATNSGAAAFDPAVQRIASEVAKAPPILIRKVSGGRVTMAEGGKKRISGLQIPPGPHRIEIAYKAIDLASPGQLDYRYQLIGYDESPVEVGSRQFASYQNLPPGEYTFEVRAKSRLGIETDSPATLAIVVQPAWHQRPLLRVGLGISLFVVMGLVAFLFRRKAVRREEAREAYSRKLIETQEEERRRIAHELHDSLGQEMLVLKGRLELAGMKHPELSGKLSGLVNDFSETIDRARSLSHDLLPPHLEHFGLSKSLESLARDLEQGSKMKVLAEIEELEPRLSGDLEIGLYRIAQEAIANIMKHSDADTVTISLKEEQGDLRLTIQDDGKGFISDSRKQQGLGIGGMAERARLFGGFMTLDSSPGRGTLVIVRLKNALVRER